LITTYRYGGQREIEKEGKKATIQVPPPAVLAHVGPFIQVSITHPRIVQEQLKAQNKDNPTVPVRALIDTGDQPEGRRNAPSRSDGLSEGDVRS
jgi:hypothetical protein